MNNSIIQAECINLKELNHLFIDLEYIKVQNKSFNVYRSRSFNQKNKKYLQMDEIKEALKNADKSKLKYIYIKGNNSMSHPEFNHILRLCLNYSSVTIFSDGSCINDKKSRFLKRVEEEGTNEIVFKVEIDHYDEKTNDEISGRGAFRKALHAITSLNKYGFNPILVVKAEKEDIPELKEGFIDLGKKFKFETEDINFSFIPNIKKEEEDNATEQTTTSSIDTENRNLDCMNSRVLSKSGIYNCPLLLNDYRGRSGASLQDFSKKCYLETFECKQCKTIGQNIYCNNWSWKTQKNRLENF